jgi:hypothetical protein
MVRQHIMVRACDRNFMVVRRERETRERERERESAQFKRHVHSDLIPTF